MGCWNETCAISNLPIHSGEDVVFLVLRQVASFQKDAGPESYSTGFWVPRTLPIYAKYNDYGAVEDWKKTEKPAIDFTLAWLRESLIERKAQCAGDVDTTKENLAFGALLNWFHEGSVYVAGNRLYEPATIPCVKVLVRRDVWDSLLEMEFEAWDRIGTFSGKSLCGEIDVLLSQIRTTSEFVGDILLDGNPKTILGESLMTMGIGGGLTDLARQIRGELAAFKAKAEKKNEKRVRFLLERYAELAFINLVFSRTRRAWAPTTGAGSQEADFLPHLEVLVRCARIAYRNEKKTLEEGLAEYKGVSAKDLDEWDAKNLRALRRDEKRLASLETTKG